MRACSPATRGRVATAAPSTILCRLPCHLAVAENGRRRRLPCHHAVRTPAAAGGPPTASAHAKLPIHVHFVSLALLPTTAAQVQRGHLVYGPPRGTRTAFAMGGSRAHAGATTTETDAGEDDALKVRVNLAAP